MLSLVWTAFIFSNSLETASESKVASGKVVEVVEQIAEKVGVEINESSSGLTTDKISFFIRKSAHFIEFAVLGIFMFFLYIYGSKSIGFSRSGYRPYLSLIFPLFVAMTDEGIQYFVPGRGAQITDVALDMAGSVIAFLICRIIVRLHKNRPKNKINIAETEKVLKNKFKYH